MSLALWLRAGRAERGLSLEDVARVTKIQTRILERLEGGAIHSGDGLPADVFVRGFIRSFAKCCGLDEAEALARYAAAAEARAQSQVSAMPAAPAARAMVEAMSELAPETARSVSAPIEIVPEASTATSDSRTVAAAPASTSSTPNTKKKRRGGKRARRKQRLATGTPSVPIAVVAVEPVAEAAPATDTAAEMTADPAIAPIVEEPAPVVVDHLDPLVVPPDDDVVIEVQETWQPTMPAPSDTPPATTVPWRRPYAAGGSKPTTAPLVPTLVIDDADPESAAQVLEDREAEKVVQRRSFLPPILLDREDRSARQGGLTLAVIILLIAATLTLSYLMRRPSSSGDGVTLRSAETSLLG